tara:strand:- start:13 stop:429 length:417 start_codon:yes stop_codon:yes gene_type:complete
MPRRKKKTTRRRKTFSILNALEAFTYASILSEGTTGGSVYAFVTGASDLKQTRTVGGVGRGDLVLSGQGQISLGDIMTEPSLAIDTMATNFQANLLPMALASFTTSIGFRVGRKILRRPLGSISRNILHPVFGKGVRM